MNQAHTTTDYSAHRFLIVDDKKFLRSLVQRMLSRCRARYIYQAEDGDAAIKILGDSCGDIDCVISDWNMEPVNGLELLRAIRGGNVPHTRRDLRFIMLTNHGDDCVVSAARHLDITGYVVKPVSLANLVWGIDTSFTKRVSLKTMLQYQSVDMVDVPVTENPDTEERSQQSVLLANKGNISKHATFSNAAGSRGNDLNSEADRQIVNLCYESLDAILPGKVLAENICSNGGTLLVSKGTILSNSLLTRIRVLEPTSDKYARILVGDYR
jgi:two-component system, chemotaxis family, chemotaxis protein CheY